MKRFIRQSLSDYDVQMALEIKCEEVYPEDLCNMSDSDKDELLETWLANEDGQQILTEQLAENRVILSNKILDVIQCTPNREEAKNKLVEYLLDVARCGLDCPSNQGIWSDTQSAINTRKSNHLEDIEAWA